MKVEKGDTIQYNNTLTNTRHEAIVSSVLSVQVVVEDFKFVFLKDIIKVITKGAGNGG